MTIGLVGGTGAQGRGLALRWALAGQTVLLGSREASRAAEAVAKIAARVAGKVDRELSVRGVTNAEAAAEADVAVVTVPYAGQRDTLAGLSDALAGKLVLCCVNAVAFDERGPYPLPVEAGSAAEEAQSLLQSSRVVGAFQHASATMLLRAEQPVEGDVLLVGDDEDARSQAAKLVASIEHLRPVEVGPLRLAAALEDFTAVLLAVNQRHKTHASLTLTGLGSS